MLGDGAFDPTIIQVPNNPKNLPLADGTQTGDGDQARVNDPTRQINQTDVVDLTSTVENETHNLSLPPPTVLLDSKLKFLYFYVI